MLSFSPRSLFGICFLLGLSLLLQDSTTAQQIQSPEVNSDGTVTFRLRSSAAEEVEVMINRIPNGKYTLEKSQEGYWEVTTASLPAGIYEYTFRVDGTRQVDPRNRWIKKWYTLESLFQVPGDDPPPQQMASVPHGSLHHHWYASDVTGGERAVIVYTPPGYFEPSNRSTQYPVLYLMHGFGDDQTAWTEVGKANVIADNLIAQKKMEPMLIVMTNGHPEPMPYGDVPRDYWNTNDVKMRKDVTQHVIPFIERIYRTASNVENRAIAGLSMGGGHALRLGMLESETFAFIGAFSAAAPQGDLIEEVIQSAKKSPRKHELIWIACGEKDFLLKRNQAFQAQLKASGIDHVYEETPAHTIGTSGETITCRAS